MFTDTATLLVVVFLSFSLAGALANQAVRRRSHRGPLLEEAVGGLGEVHPHWATHHGVVRAAAARQADGALSAQGVFFSAEWKECAPVGGGGVRRRVFLG